MLSNSCTTASKMASLKDQLLLIMLASDRSLLANLAFGPRGHVAMELSGWLRLGLLLSLARFAIQISISNNNSVSALKGVLFPASKLSRAAPATSYYY